MIGKKYQKKAAADKKLLRLGNDVKARRSRLKEFMSLKLTALEMDIKLYIIHELTPLGLIHIGEVFKQEVETLAGDRYRRNGEPGHVRWSKQWGLVYIAEQKAPVRYQRVRNRSGKLHDAGNGPLQNVN
ncbi:MAG: hypothetical protein JSW12_03890 [Deltaproteobacteria bacterium]|nr:MAG: hypothetical protein JSW12_03890 [Deltaproteobacteria bacterium]